MASAPETRKPDEVPSIVVTVDGTDWPIRFGELTGSLVRRVREAAGMPWQKVIETVADPDLRDIDTIAVLVWVARIQAGEELPLAEIGDSINYESKLAINWSPDAAEDDNPEA